MEKLTEEQFKATCIVAENANYYYVMRIDHDLITGQYRIPKHRAIGFVSTDYALTEAYEWYMDGMSELEFEKQAQEIINGARG